MGHTIKALRVRLVEIAVDRMKFGFNERPIGTQVVHRRREDTHSFVREEEVIGREDERKAVKELLLDSNVKENVSIIPIVGIGGQGKTTLAQYVFNDKEVQIHFELRSWVCVSEVFDVKTIVQKIIECAVGRRPESLEMEFLQHELRAKIDGKRYLLVLDDVWNENRDTWLRLETLLLGGLKGSKVLITTRDIKVAEITGTMSPLFLGCLSKSNSWKLFKRMAFKDGEEPTNLTLVEIGREIVQKCAQVPLAIRIIGSLLYFKNSEVDWLDFKNNELYRITPQDKGIFPILKLSYDHFPPQLKECFRFCSLFPKDSEIEVQLLIQLWIAQGFIHSSDRNRRLEDISHEYFMDLLRRSFFQDIQRNEYGDILKCKMHYLIHDLAQSIAEDECIISNSNVEKVVERTRHVGFDSLDSLPDIPALLLKANKMRTLLFRIRSPLFYDHEPVLEWKPVYDTIISSFKCLRALNMSCLSIQKVPNSIGKLKHLRFLDLSRNYEIKRLPNSITKLQNLQTLRLDFCSGLKNLPKDTRDLISLRHLGLYECKSLTHMPNGLGKLTALQTLTLYRLGKKGTYVSKQKVWLGDLDSLDELRGELHIKGLEQLRSSPLEGKAANLERKQHLQILKLEWDSCIEAGDDSDKAIANDEQLLQNLRPHLNLKQLSIVGYAGVRSCSWLSLLSNLVKITMRDCKWCRHIPPLDQLPFLKCLSLIDLSALEYISYDGSGMSFSSLENFHLKNLPKFKGWWRIRETVTAEICLPLFPCLSSLRIDNCPIMSLIPVIVPGSQATISSSPSLSTLSKLKFLGLCRLEELESLPEELLQNLTSLETLQIWECCELQIFMSPLLQHLIALEELQICNCKELISNENIEGAQCLGPTTLRSLFLLNITSLMSLPRELRHVTTLQTLDIENCPTLMSLPEWIGDFTSLWALQIHDCPNLISLPEGMLRLTSLHRLIIKRCPLLEERCEEGTGEEWPKIAHIPNFSTRKLFFIAVP
jgi:Leucine-rich repeat (LRR) protein